VKNSDKKVNEKQRDGKEARIATRKKRASTANKKTCEHSDEERKRAQRRKK